MKFYLSGLFSLFVFCLITHTHAQPGKKLFKLAAIGPVSKAVVPNNIARASNGAVAFATDQLYDLHHTYAIHKTSNLNDGQYGNSNSWIGGVKKPGYVGITLPGNRIYSIKSFSFGRDNLGRFIDRTAGTYDIQVTKEDPRSKNSTWTSIGKITYPARNTGKDHLRHLYEISKDTPVYARGFRIAVPRIGLHGGIAIDEIEIYGDVKKVDSIDLSMPNFKHPYPRPPKYWPWRKMPGAAWDIGVGGKWNLWVIGTNPEGGGFGIYQWQGWKAHWRKVPGSGTRIDVDPHGNPWIVNKFNDIYFNERGRWSKTPYGKAYDIGIGMKNTPFVCGTNRKTYQWDSRIANWVDDRGAPVIVALDVDHMGYPWVTTTRGGVWQKYGAGRPGPWRKHPSPHA
ncbi:hypothetical protein ACFL35_12120, partial [Candidatus Riflebacteria bacterium]